MHSTVSPSFSSHSDVHQRQWVGFDVPQDASALSFLRYLLCKALFNTGLTVFSFALAFSSQTVENKIKAWSSKLFRNVCHSQLVWKSHSFMQIVLVQVQKKKRFNLHKNSSLIKWISLLADATKMTILCSCLSSAAQNVALANKLTHKLGKKI